jgi:1,2-diacylglycerol 3-alpha-glucosyltransferase
MKILLTSDWYAPAINGVVTSVQNLRAGLQARGHEVRVLTLSQSLRTNYGTDISYIGSMTAGKIYPGARIRTLPSHRLKQQLVNWAPDIIHSNCEFSTFHPACNLSQALGVPLVHTYHTVYENYTHYFSPSPRLGRQMVRTFSRRIAARTDCLIAPTEKTAALLRGYGIETPIHVVPTGIDFSRLDRPMDDAQKLELRRSLGIPDGNTVLACVGRLAKEKNAEELLQFMTRLGDLPVTLLLVGGGPYQAVLEAEVDRLGIRDRVVLTGMVPPDRIGTYYRLGDLFVCASTSETQGLTYLEALACGLPLLCRADDCLADVVTQGEDGWQYHDEAQFRQYLDRFLSSPALQATLRANALETAKRYSVEAFAAQMESVYLDLLRRPHRVDTMLRQASGDETQP